jgi:hypothetical protein
LTLSMNAYILVCFIRSGVGCHNNLLIFLFFSLPNAVYFFEAHKDRIHKINHRKNLIPDLPLNHHFSPNALPSPWS